MGSEDVSETMGKALGHLERITEHVCNNCSTMLGF